MLPNRPHLRTASAAVTSDAERGVVHPSIAAYVMHNQNTSVTVLQSSEHVYESVYTQRLAWYETDCSEANNFSASNMTSRSVTHTGIATK